MGVERKTRSKKSKTKTNKWVENENGLYIANMGKNWTSADTAHLWHARGTLGQPYKQIQKHLLRTALSMRLKYHHLKLEHEKSVAQGAESATPSEEGEEGETGDLPPLHGIELILAAANVREKQRKAHGPVALEKPAVQKTTPRTKTAPTEVTAKSTAWKSEPHRVKICNLVE